VLFCDGTLAAPNDSTRGPVAAVLGAALNRSTLTSQAHQPTTDPAAFYQQRLTNHYARAMHAATRDGKAYGFAFDDVAGFASYIEDGAPKEITLTLTPF
ncbi:beta-1,3-glucanase family protein, partial [Streptomyces decoyicus]